MQLKEVFGNTARERDQAIAECQRLKDILAHHGINPGLTTPGSSYNASMPSYTGSTSGSRSGSYRQDSASTAMSPSPINGQIPHMQASNAAHAQSAGQLPPGALDYDQLGIDFVLAYDPHGRPHGRLAYPSPPPGQ